VQVRLSVSSYVSRGLRLLPRADSQSTLADVTKPERQQRISFKDSDFAGVARGKRQALIDSLNALSEQAHHADEALKNANFDYPSSSTGNPATDSVPQAGQPAGQTCE